MSLFEEMLKEAETKIGGGGKFSYECQNLIKTFPYIHHDSVNVPTMTIQNILRAAFREIYDLSSVKTTVISAFIAELEKEIIMLQAMLVETTTKER